LLAWATAGIDYEAGTWTPDRVKETRGNAMTKRLITAVIGLSMLTLTSTACGTLSGAAVGAAGGAAIGYGTGYGVGKGVLVGTGVGAAAGAIYDIYNMK
jgi:osmotically inducible lipoprotein OsmB